MENLLNHYQCDIKGDVQAALTEDLLDDASKGELGSSPSDFDITAQLIDDKQSCRARIITREHGVLCGAAWAQEAFTQVDKSLTLNWRKADGDSLNENDIIVEVSGNARSILTAERTALNFLQFLSGTATVTHCYSKLLQHSTTTLLDTRKTLPRYRQAQKYAVVCGGGKNHRIGLYDAFLIKENHIKACGSIQKAISKARRLKPDTSIELEVENIDELHQAILAGADTVMLDNFNNKQVQEAVALASGKCKLEVSGNITDERLLELASTGVDFVSSGALTKHVKALDLSLLID
ncbi:carboxylating nicotinate-nucleotide diphosphorylase [Ningiella sp. W23]|uniref:carboxylating nicotinate-nucleotide diphosphorylase n=1 Tax=Ningiella sp. W23 TaxID=3023715 RepID=UPI003757139A